ncbi:hypothetical protein THAOC_11606, partial [Thalassiosira oceanica]
RDGGVPPHVAVLGGTLGGPVGGRVGGRIGGTFAGHRRRRIGGGPGRRAGRRLRRRDRRRGRRVAVVPHAHGVGHLHVRPRRGRVAGHRTKDDVVRVPAASRVAVVVAPDLRPGRGGLEVRQLVDGLVRQDVRSGGRAADEVVHALVVRAAVPGRVLPAGTVGRAERVDAESLGAGPGAALVQLPHLPDVVVRQPDALSHALPPLQRLDRHDGLLGGVLDAEPVVGVVHYAPEVVLRPKDVDVDGLVEVPLGAVDDVLPLDADVLVPVGAGVLVPESQGVEHLVHDRAAVLHLLAPSQVDVRRTVRLPSQVRRAYPRVVRLGVEVDVLRLRGPGYEPEHARGRLDVRDGRRDRLVGLGPEHPRPDRVGDLEPSAGRAVLRLVPKAVDVVRRAEYPLKGAGLLRLVAVRSGPGVVVVLARLEVEAVGPHPLGELPAVPLHDVAVAGQHAPPPKTSVTLPSPRTPSEDSSRWS